MFSWQGPSRLGPGDNFGGANGAVRPDLNRTSDGPFFPHFGEMGDGL